MSDKPVSRANLITGSIVLGLLLLIGGYYGIKQLIKPAAVPAPKYVAYFENSGGLQEGDAVRIQGRRAGRVTGVDVVMRDGKAYTRVEFEIAPGSSSQWLKETTIPGDSTISVKKPALMGRSQLIITIGSDDEDPIEEGGEWTRTRSANDQDQLTQWNEDIVKTRTELANVLKFFDDREGFERLKNELEELSDVLRQVDSNIAGVTENTGQIDKFLTSAIEGMDSARNSLQGRGENSKEGLVAINDNLKRMDEEFGRIDEQLSATMAEVERLRESSDSMVSSTDKAQLEKLGLDLRKQATRLRASMERAVSDPSQAGDMPNWRRTRPYFHGGEPRVGTSIDSQPPSAPAERSGVPKGIEDTKRVK